MEFKGSHFEKAIIHWGVRWYVAYPVSYQQLEEMMQERGHTVPLRVLSMIAQKFNVNWVWLETGVGTPST